MKSLKWLTIILATLFVLCSMPIALAVNGDGIVDGAEECDDGNFVNGDGCSAVFSREGMVFFTTSTYSNGELGGIAGADAICNALADNSNLPGIADRTFKAWLSDRTSNIRDRLAQNIPFYNINGQELGVNLADLLNGPNAPINIDENGNVLNDWERVWTGTRDDGTYDARHSYDCLAWTSRAPWVNGDYGLMGGGILWTDAHWNDFKRCDMGKRLYCIADPMSLPPAVDFSWNPADAHANDNIFFTDQSIDLDGNVVSWSWDLGDGGTSKMQNPQHSYTSGGTYNVKLTATDNAGRSSFTIKPLTVLNTAPVFNALGNQNIDEGQQLQFAVLATDIDANDVLTYSAAGLPVGAVFNPATRTFTWTPDFTQEGIYQITFTANDGNGGIANLIIQITVDNVNQAPSFQAIGNKDVDEGQLLEFTVTATDADNDVLQLSAANLPAGSKFSDNEDGTGKFTWTPDFTQAGDYKGITFTANDGNGGVATAIIEISVNDFNSAPIISVDSDWTVDEGELLQFNVNAIDNEGDHVQLSASDLPAGSNFVDNGD
ncbi:MAG: PKD domain-containing protein, partial [archaeon]